MKTLIIALCLSLISLSASADDKVIRIGTQGDYPPFTFLDAKGTLSGFDVDIGNALCQQMKVKCKWVVQAWDGIIPGLIAHKYDAIMSSMSITPERAKAVLFSDPYYSNKLQFVGEDSKPFSPTKKTADGKVELIKANLQGKAIGTERATLGSQWLKQNLDGVVTVKLYDSLQEAFLDLKAGRINGILADKYPSYAWLKTPAGKGFAFMGDPVYSKDKIGIALRKNETDLAKQFNDAIKAIVANGVYKKVNAKYFPFSIY